MRISAEPSRNIDDYRFHHQIRVRFAETDAMGVVHHSRVLPYLEEGRVAYLRHLDHPYTEWRDRGIDSAVLELFVQYIRPMRFDEVVDVHLALTSATRTTFQMAYLLRVDDVACATAVTVHGLLNATGRPIRLPEWLIAIAMTP